MKRWLHRLWQELNRNDDHQSLTAFWFWCPAMMISVFGAIAFSLWLIHTTATSLNPESLFFVAAMIFVELIALSSVVVFPSLVLCLEMLVLRGLNRRELAYVVFLDELSANPKHTRCPAMERTIARLLHAIVGPRP